MEQIHIYLCCRGGLSSGFLSQRARQYIKKNKIFATIDAISESEVQHYFSKMDILMIGPHMEYRLDSLTEQAKAYHFPIIIIPGEIYEMLDGEGLVKLALEKVNTNKV